MKESFQTFKIHLTAKILCFGRKWTTGPGDLAGPPKRKILKVFGNPTQSRIRLTVIRVITSEETHVSHSSDEDHDIRDRKLQL